jgi:hypothetical protein
VHFTIKTFLGFFITAETTFAFYHLALLSMKEDDSMIFRALRQCSPGKQGVNPVMRRFNLMLMVLLAALFFNSGTAFADRFVDMGDGTVLDTTSHLRWLKNAYCFMSQNWATAMSSANNLAPPACGLNDGSVAGDWHLPTIDELRIFVDDGYRNNTLNAAGFLNVMGIGYYWSSSVFPYNPDWIYTVSMSTGEVSQSLKEASNPVWPIRDGLFYHALAAVSPASKDFGRVTIKTTSVQTFTLSNSGTQNLVVGSMTLTGGDAPLFSLNTGDGTGGSCGATPSIAPAGSCTVSVSFTPTSAGSISAGLLISSNDLNTPGKTVALTGSGVAQVIQSYDPNVSWWRAENNANDSVGSNNGTLHGVTYAPGRVGQAFSFDGSVEQYVSVPHSSSLNILGNHSIAFWVKLNALPAAGKGFHVVSKWTNGYEYKRVSIDSDGKISYFLYGTTTTLFGSTPSPGITSAAALQSGVWSHVVATYDGASMKIYINGVQDANTAEVHNDVGDGVGALYLGYDPATASYMPGGEAYFNGQLDEVGWYDRTLSQAEVTSLNDGTPAAFSFTPRTGVPINTSIESSPATVTGFYLPAAITVSGGEYALSSDNGATWGGWTIAQGTFSPDNQVMLRLTSSGTYDAQAAATVTIGVVSASFSATTIRFIDLGDGTMLDAVSQLRWLKIADCFGQQNWDAAMPSAAGLASPACGLSDGSAAGDWHLPTIDELRQFVDAGYRYDTLNTAGFTGIQASYYWSSSTDAGDTNRAWFVLMNDGGVGLTNKSSSSYVWPVRAGQYWTVGSLVVTGTAEFGTQAVGSVSSGHQFVLKNAGTGPLPVTSSVLGGANPDQFSLTPGGSSPCASLTPTLAAGASCTLLVMAAPTSAGSKSASLIVTTADGDANAALTVLAFIPAPTISYIAPTSGYASGGTTVTITGANLTGATAVMFGANATTSKTVETATQITAVSPAGVVGQVVDITVTTPGGTSATSSADQFTYTLQYQAKNQTTGTPYATLAEAISAALAGAEIRAYGGQLDGAVTLGTSLFLNGGYNYMFDAKDSLPTTLNGGLTVTGGTATVESVTVKGVLIIANGSLQSNGVTVRP